MSAAAEGKNHAVAGAARALSVNRLAAPLVAQLLASADALGIALERLDNGVTVVDAGIDVRGSVAAGVLIGEICMGGLGSVRLATRVEDGWPDWLEVSSAQPVLACLASHRDQANAEKAAAETAARFGCELRGVGTDSAEARRAALGGADVVLATAAAGVQVMSADEVAGAARLLVAADVNAVPPEGIAGVGVMDKGKPIAGTQAVGIGALAVGNVKYQVENGLLVAMRQADKPLYLGFREAFAKARELLADKS